MKIICNKWFISFIFFTFAIILIIAFNAKEIHKLINECFEARNLNCLIPVGWQKGNGLDGNDFPFFIKTYIGKNASPVIVLHYSHTSKGEYYPDKHVISFFHEKAGKYIKRWSEKFDDEDGIYFLVTDLNKDGHKELVVNGVNSGSGGYGHLWIFQLNDSASAIKIFDKEMQGDIYLWDTDKHRLDLNPAYFQDLNKDGIVEILVGHREESCDKDVHCEADKSWWLDVYKWNGKTYVLADSKFPEFYKEELAKYEAFVKEKGECESVRAFIEKTKKLAEAKSQR